MAKTKAQIIAEAQVVKNATEVGENTATRVGGVLEDLADADSVVIIPVTGTSSGGSITLSSNPFTQVQTAVNAGQHAIVRVTIGNDVVDFSMNTYSDSVSTYIGASKFLQQEFQMTCTSSGTVIESINTSNTFSTGESVPNVGIDDVPTQGSDNLVKSGGVYNEVSQLGQKVTGYELTDNFNITSTGAHSSTSDRLSFNPVIPKGTYILLIESGTSGNAGIIGLYPHYVGDSGNTNIGTIYINVPTQVTLAKDMDSLGLYMSAVVNTGIGTMPLTIRSVSSVAQSLDKLSGFEDIKREVTGAYTLQFPVNGNARLNQAVPLNFTGKCHVTMRVVSGTDTWKWRLYRNINGTKGEALTGEINLGSSVDIDIPATDSGVWAYSVAGSVTVGRIYELAFTQIDQTLNGEVKSVKSLAEENQADINKQETQSTLTSVHTSSSRYMAVANGGKFTSSSSGAAVNFYKITKGRKYIISAPKGVNSACYGLAYANVIGDNLSDAQVHEFTDTVGTSATPFNYTINAADDYGYLCVGYIAADGQPTVIEVSMSYRFALADANEDKAKIRMLCFGNSFTQDSVNYAPFILKGLYPECDLTICMAIIGGSPLAQHCANITGVAQSDGTNTYNPGVKYNVFYFHNGSSAWEEGSQLTAPELLQIEAWDIVTFQQGGQVNYGNYNTYYKPFLNSTFKALNGILTNPYKIGWLLTHGAYDTTAAGVLSHWEGSKNNTEQLLEETPVSVLFPYGTAIQNLRTTPISVGAYGEGVLQADTAHLQEGIPTLCASYSIVLTLLDIAGVNWRGVMGEQTRPDYAWITGHNCPGTNYATPGVVEGVTDENCYLAQFAAIAAKEHPFVVTQVS